MVDLNWRNSKIGSRFCGCGVYLIFEPVYLQHGIQIRFTSLVSMLPRLSSSNAYRFIVNNALVSIQHNYNTNQIYTPLHLLNNQHNLPILSTYQAITPQQILPCFNWLFRQVKTIGTCFQKKDDIYFYVDM